MINTMNKRVSFAFLLLLSFFSLASAATHIVDDNNASLDADYSTIAAAIAGASNGDTILVQAGNYSEFTVNKKLTLIGSTDPFGSNPVLVSPSNSSVSAIIEITSSNVKLSDFKIDGSANIGDGNHRAGIRVNTDASNSDLSNIDIKNNYVLNINRGSSGSGFSSLGIQLYTDARTVNQYKLDNIEVTGNTIFNVTSSLGGAYGIQTVDDVEDTLIEENNITLISGAWSIGVAVDSHNGSTTITEVIISSNYISDIPSGAAVLVESTTTASNVLVNHNDFIDVGTGVYSIDFSEELDATFNDWESCDGPSQAPSVFPFLGPIYPYPASNGSGTFVFGNVSYEPWIGICFINLVNPSCPNELANSTVSFEVKSLNGVDEAWISYEINGSIFYVNATDFGNGTYSAIIPSTNLIGGENVIWTTYARDEFGNVLLGETDSFYVNFKTVLSVDPTNPDGLNNWYVTEPEFTLSNPDSIDIFYQWDSDDIFLYSSPFMLEDIPNQPNVSAGILDLNFWSDYSCGNETNQKEFFYIDLTSPLITDLYPSDDEVIYNKFNLNLSAYIDEVYQSNSGVNLTTVTIELNGILVNSSKGLKNLDALIWYPSVLASGVHEVRVNATDKAGRRSTKTWTFEIIETTVASLTVNSPVEGIYNYKKTPINISLSDNVDILEYIDYSDKVPKFRTLCRNCDEYGLLNLRTKNLGEGGHILGFRATDFLGQTNEINVSLFIDSVSPKISKTLSEKNGVTNGSDFYIKYTEENVAEVLLLGNTTLNLTEGCNLSGKNQECFFDIDLDAFDGETINYQFNITDIAGNKGSSKLTSVLVDTTAPVLNLFDYSIENRVVNFKFNVSEINFKEINYVDLNEANPRLVKICTNLKNGICEKKRAFSKGEHNLTINIIDKAGNSFVIQNVEF